jgi:hypothetical protein
MGYPYWVDTRLVAINAGYPQKDYAMFADQLSKTVSNPNAKLFIINTQDMPAVQALQQTYPKGWLEIYHSSAPTKDFLMFLVPPRQ